MVDAASIVAISVCRSRRARPCACEKRARSQDNSKTDRCPLIVQIRHVAQDRLALLRRRIQHEDHCEHILAAKRYLPPWVRAQELAY
eukprot:scaffold161402_cov30-Tisochrysis_lutea.AAC.6